MESDIFNLVVGQWNEVFGSPVSEIRLKIKDLKFIEERDLKHQDVWQGGSMSLVGRKVLIDSFLNSWPIYYMPMLMFQKTFCVCVQNSFSYGKVETYV
jgi:hypothetical protein